MNQPPNLRRALIVTIEGLGTNLVGCYGAAIAPTKHWDAFASRSIVIDQFWADTIRPSDILESMWTGTHFAARSSEAPNHSPNSQEFWERAMLVTDAPEMLDSLAQELFGSLLLVDPTQDSKEVPEEESAVTQIGRLFETALGRWASEHSEFPILWIHSRGLHGAWDAPYEYRCVMCDEGDPDPPREIEPAQLRVTSQTDPDEVFGLACAMGGQAIAMDEAWAMVQSAISELGLEKDCLQILAGTGGYPMGEHGWVGDATPQLYAEALHLPLIIRPANDLFLGIRVPFMVQPHSLRATLQHWMQGGGSIAEASFETNLLEDNAPLPNHDWKSSQSMAYSRYQDQQHLAVAAWSCRWTKSREEDLPETETVELFATPEDRWQQNEVSQRAASVVEELVLHRDHWLECIQQGDAGQLKPLDHELTHPIR